MNAFPLVARHNFLPTIPTIVKICKKTKLGITISIHKFV